MIQHLRAQQRLNAAEGKRRYPHRAMRISSQGDEDILTRRRGYPHKATRISSQGDDDILTRRRRYPHKALRLVSTFDPHLYIIYFCCPVKLLSNHYSLLLLFRLHCVEGIAIRKEPCGIVRMALFLSLYRPTASLSPILRKGGGGEEEG